MDCIIEDGFNTSYISALLFVLFFEKSIIERYLLLENFSDSNKILYLQKLIQLNYVEPIRNNVCIYSSAINEIRLCLFAIGMRELHTIDEFCIQHEPIDLFIFLCKLINFVPIKYTSNSLQEMSYYIDCQNVKNNIQTSYDIWSENKTIDESNPPPFIVFKISNIENNFGITKKIKLFKQTSHLSGINWIFHGLFYRGKKKIAAITRKNGLLYSLDLLGYPSIKKMQTFNLIGLKNTDVYVIYHKEIVI